MNMKRPHLSICMIFKNDIRSLERCLDALKPLREAVCCELVMADTGSTDGSRAVAERYADILFDFPWVNDFSAARNAVMDRASGEWYLTVDSDEYLDPDISQLVAFLALPRHKQDAFAAVVQRNYRTRDMAGDDYSDFMAQRMARRDTGARYQGRIHETWPQGSQIPTYVLDHVILHHDGYAIDDQAAKKAKMERNLILLRQELAISPKDPSRLLQCIESSRYHKEERLGYLHQAMEFVQHGQVAAGEEGYLAPLYRYAVCAALEDNQPQAEEWLAWGKAQPFFQSIICRIDVSAAATVYYHAKKNYQIALDWVNQYEQACADYWSKQYDLIEISISTPTYAVPNSMLFGRLLRCECLEQLGHQEESLHGLESLDFTRLCHASTLFFRCLSLLTKLQEVREGACALYGRILSTLWKLDEPKNAQVQELKRACLLQANQIFLDRTGGWKLYAQAPGELGQAARIMDLTDQEALINALNSIEHWEEAPSSLVLHAVEQAVPMPLSFYQQGEERLRSIAAALGNAPTLGTYLPQWVRCDNFESSIIRLQFLFQLLSAVLRGTDWGSVEKPDELCNLFGTISARYISSLYNPTMIEHEENWIALPGLHRFALYLTRANTMLAQGDELGYVRTLKSALDIAPAMKNMVDFLLKQLEKRQCQSTPLELLELADKVRTILSQYPPNDPTVAALKQSEAYQRVAYLIEGMEAPSLSGLPQ